MKRGNPIIYLISLLAIIFSANKSVGQRHLLHEFAKQKNARWMYEKIKADSLANAFGIPIYYVERDSNKVVILQRLGRKNKPVYYATDNIDAAETISVDKVWNSNNEYPSLTGEGVEINLWDGGSIRASHQELQSGPGSRITMRDLELPLSSHSTHIAGTMIASGVNPTAKGMAGKSTINAWDLNDDIAEMSGAAADGIVVSNHSYGPLCGWDYNSINESWYWFGDPDISATEDYEFGFYNQVSADLDYIAELAPQYLIVKSAGNDRNDGPTTSFVHYVWDETWKLVDVEREPNGGTDGFDCLTPMAVAKNILTVGAVDDAIAMTSFSAYGPTDDGRIKPDVVANGSDVFSSTSATDSSYVTYSGTSMSTASVTGSVALLHQLQNTLQPGIKLLSSTIKGLLIHTATDLGNTGPDYSYGWGLLNIKEAADLIYANSHNQGKNIYEVVLANDGEIVIPVTTQSSALLKVTICWTDPAGQASTPSLNPRNTKLVNDLDILVVNSNSLETYLPWILDVDNPVGLATRNSNHIDNVEQIYIANPGENNFNIKISHSGTLSGGSQKLSLIISGIETTSNIFPPKNLTYTINESSILLNWNPPDSGTPESYKIYRNGNLLAVTENTSFLDQSIVLDNPYEYYVTAEYVLNSVNFESIGTNQISVFPQTLQSLPFLVDFEQEPNEILYQNSLDGWQWGDSESLNSYYLDFSDNTTKFIGIDSYSAGDAIHVSDIAITVPLRLGNYNNIILSFDYLLKTGIYDAIDELHVVYKLQEEKEWHELKILDKAFNWAYHSFELPPDMCINGTQIGFYYDDFYQWGMGAGIDNIRLDGILNNFEDISLETISSPENIMCLQENPLDLVIEINNSGNTSILTGEVLQITTSCQGIQKINNYTLTQNLNPENSITVTYQNLIDPLPVGNYIVMVEVAWANDQNSSNNSISKTITINNLPEISFINSPDKLCENGEAVLLTATPEGGTFVGDFLEGDTFNPSTAGVGAYEISYTYTDVYGCFNSESITIEVFSMPDVSIEGLLAEYCAEDSLINVIGNPAGGVFTTTSIFNETPGLRSYDLSYSYTDENKCTFTDTETFTILPEPEVILPSELDFSEQDTITIKLENPEHTFVWSNDSTSNAIQLIGSAMSSGENTISLTVQNEFGCSITFEYVFYVDAITQLIIDSTENEMLLYPNPANKLLNILLPEIKSIAIESILTVRNINGKLMEYLYIPQNHGDKLVLDIKDLPPGLYLLTLTYNGIIYKGKIVIRR